MNSAVSVRDIVLNAVGEQWETAAEIAKRLELWSVSYVRAHLQYLAAGGKVWRVGEYVHPVGITHKYCRIQSDLPDLVIERGI